MSDRSVSPVVPHPRYDLGVIDTNVEQDAEMRQLLGELEMLSHGSVQSWNASGSGENDSKLLADGKSVAPKPPHEVWRDRYGLCEHDAQRRRVIEGARGELREWRGYGRQPAKNVLSDAEILDARILEAEGWLIRDVAIRLRCTETRVRKVRLAKGVSAVDGVKRDPLLVDGGLAVRVRELGLRGMTERQIRMLTGMATSSIRRVLGRPV